MKQNNGILLAALFFVLTAMSSCEVIGDIFQAGVWVGVLLVVLVVGIILWVIRKVKK